MLTLRKVKYVFYGLLFVSWMPASGQSIAIANELDIPLTGAHVHFSNATDSKGFTLVTNRNGEVDFIPELTAIDSNWEVEIRYLGYTPIRAVYYSGSDTIYKLYMELVTLNQVVITGQHSPNSSDKSVHAVKVIDRKRMEAQAAVNLKDILQSEMNIRIGQDNILGSSMSLQGMSGQHVKILVDGVPVIGRVDGNLDLSQINLANVERIEIVEGPLAVNYGSDALAGTINIITKKEQDSSVETTLNSYLESVGQYNIDGRLGFSSGSHQVAVNGGRNFFDGWSVGDAFLISPGQIPVGDSRNQQWNPKEQIFGGAFYRFNKEKISIRPFADWFYEEVTNRGVPREPYFDSAFDDLYRTWRSNTGADIRAAFDSTHSVHLLAAFNRYDRIKNTYLKDLATLEEVLTESQEDQDTTRFDVFMSRGIWVAAPVQKRWSAELGYDVNYETGTGKRIGSGEQSQGDFAVFTTLEWSPVERLLIKPGVRVSYNTAYKAPVIPSLNVRFKLNHFTYRASWAKGFRAPSLKELYFEFIDINHFITGNETLNAETSNNAAVQVQWQQIYGQKILNVEISAFYNVIDNLITLAQTDMIAAQFSYINVGDFKSIGTASKIELALEHLKLSVGSSYTGRYNGFPVPTATNKFTFSPEFRTSILYNWHSTGLTFGAFYTFNGSLPNYFLGADGEMLLTQIDSYHLLDITVSRNLCKDRISLTLGGKNLFNVVDVSVLNGGTGGVHSASSTLTPIGWGRSVSLGFKYNI